MIKYPCECSDEDTGHNYVSESLKLHESMKLEVPVIFYQIECGSCGHKSEIDKSDWDMIAGDELRAAQRSKANLTRYPRIEPHTGMLVSSKQHESEMVKAMGFHKAENGLNEKFHDETAETLRKKRQDLAERRKAMQERRRAHNMRVPGVKKRA